MQSSHRIYKDYQQRDCDEARKIPVRENPVAGIGFSSSVQAESLIRQSKHRADELVRLAENECKEMISRAIEEAGEAVEAEKKKAYEAGYKVG
ncbi:MAG: hypothetical protein C0604_04970, partial [Clostridiales bacterium]